MQIDSQGQGADGFSRRLRRCRFQPDPVAHDARRAREIDHQITHRRMGHDLHRLTGGAHILKGQQLTKLMQGSGKMIHHAQSFR